MLIAALVAGLSAGPVSARPLLLPAQVVSATGTGPRLGLVVVPLDAPASAQQAVLELVGEDAVRVAGRFDLVQVADLFDPKAAAERAQKLEAARARMVEGQKHLDDLDTAKGTEAFADALKQLKETDTAQTFGELTKAWVMKAAGHALAGETPAAKQEIERIVAVNAKAEFNPQFFPPDLLKFVEAQRKLSNLAKGELTVATEPANANVWVDGQLRGRSPVTVSGLLGGRHQVVASLGGRTLTLAELPPGSSSLELPPAELAPNLKKAIDGCVKAPKAKGRDQALVTLGKALGVEQVLAVLVKKSPTGEQFELTGVRLEVRDGHNAGFATATVPLGEPSDALKGFFDSMLVTDTPRKGKEIVTHFDGDSGGGGSGKTVVGVALLGVAAGLVGAGVGTGVVGQQRYEQFRATPQVQTGIAQGYANEARLLGGVSLGSFIGAGVAAGVGIFFLASGGGGGADSSAEEPKPGKKRDPKKDAAPKKDVSKKTDPKKDEPPKDEPKKDEAKKDEAKKDEPKKDEPKKDEPKVDPKEEKRRKDEEARLKKEEEARAKAEAEEKKRKEEEDEKKRKEDEAATKKLSKKEEKKKAEEDKRKAEEEKKKAEEEAKKAEEEKKKEEARRAEEERKKKEAEKKKEEDHDDLRNF